jgi:hypothetical protein
VKQEQIDQIRADYENEFPRPLSIEWSVPKSRYMPLNEFNADQQIRAIANEYQFGLDTWKAAHARYAARSQVQGDSLAEQSEFPECSGDELNCPENEGHGCCGRGKSNQQEQPQ